MTDDLKVTKEYKDSPEYVKKHQVMSDATAFMISSVLQDVALTGGTPHNVACKTGTTNFDENIMNKYNMPGDAIRDSWVIGYSPQTTIGMWYGYDSFDQESINAILKGEETALAQLIDILLLFFIIFYD